MADLDAFDALILPHAAACPVPTVAWAVRLACIDFCSRVEVVTDDVNITTVSGQAFYDPYPTGALVARRVLRLLRGETPVYPLEYFLTANGRLGMNPVPTDVAVLSATFALRPTITATTVPDVLVTEHMETIAAGALARIHRFPGQPWTDFNLAQMRQQEFDRACGVAQWHVDALSRGSEPLRTTPNPI